MPKALDELLKQIDQQEEETAKSAFEVIDLETAAEAIRRISYFNEKMDELDSIMEKQIAPFLEKIELIKNWNVEAKQEYLDNINHYCALLEIFARNEIPRSKKRSIKLPYGTISLKKQQPEFNKDDDILFAYAKERNLVRIKEETDWATIKKSCQIVNGRLVDENGEIIPGVLVTEREDKCEVKIGE